MASTLTTCGASRRKASALSLIGPLAILQSDQLLLSLTTFGLQKTNLRVDW